MFFVSQGLCDICANVANIHPSTISCLATLSVFSEWVKWEADIITTQAYGKFTESGQGNSLISCQMPYTVNKVLHALIIGG